MNWFNLFDALPIGTHFYLMPKNNNGLGAFFATLAANFPEHLSNITNAVAQEPADNFTTPAQWAQYRQMVIDAAAIVRPHGVKNGVELSSWTVVGPPGTEGGEEALLAMLPSEAIDDIGISFFTWAGNRRFDTQVDIWADWLGEHFPGIPWGGASCGISVPAHSALDAPIRTTRAESARVSFERLIARGATHASWYDVGKPSNSAHGDLAVDAQLLPVLQDLKASMVVQTT